MSGPSAYTEEVERLRDIRKRATAVEVERLRDIRKRESNLHRSYVAGFFLEALALYHPAGPVYRLILDFILGNIDETSWPLAWESIERDQKRRLLGVLAMRAQRETVGAIQREKSEQRWLDCWHAHEPGERTTLCGAPVDLSTGYRGSWRTGYDSRGRARLRRAVSGAPLCRRTPCAKAFEAHGITKEKKDSRS